MRSPKKKKAPKKKPPKNARKGAASPTSVRAVTAAEKQAQAMALRKSGVSMAEIAAQLGYADHSGARVAILAGIRHLVEEPAAEVLALELARLDRLQEAVWPRATGKRPSLAAIDRALKIMAQRARLLGLEGPIKLEHAGPDGGPIPLETKTNVLVTLNRLTEEYERLYAERGTTMRPADSGRITGDPGNDSP